MESKSSNLSFDMVFEILSRSSLKTLANCRLVSKQCNLLTYESSFLNLHSKRTQTLSGFFLQSMKYNKTYSTFVSSETPECKNISLDFLPSPSVRIHASSTQGVLVCVDDNGTRISRIPHYYVCKPTTKEWQLIPNPKTKFFTESMGIQVLKSNPLEYKIVRLSQPKQRFVGIYKYYCLRCEIYDSMVGKWRQTKELIKLPYDEQLISWDPAISVGGRFHWRTMKNNVFAFDVDDEKYCLFSFPNSPNRFHLTDYEGKLSVVCKGDKFFELWVMEDYQKKEWRKRMRVSTESVEKEKNLTFYPAAFCNADMAFVPGYYSSILFKFKNGSRVDEVRSLDSNIVRPEGVFPFRSDSELCNMKNELFNKHYSNGKSRKEKRKPIEEEYMSSSHIQPCFRRSPTFVFLFVLFFFTLVCFVLDL